MNMISLLQDYNIPYSTEGKNISEGWIGMQCCWCDDTSNHMGWNIDEEYFSCWKCGKHQTSFTIARLLAISEFEARKIIESYGSNMLSTISGETEVIVRAKAHKLPSNTFEMDLNHRLYLTKRGFDHEKLEKEWNLLGTGPVSSLDKINFRFRIIIPVIWNNKQISFTSRDITGKSELRYISCPNDRELVHHKNILYGRQELWTNTGICVEGPADAWRMGSNSFATFGIKYTPAQVREMAKAFKRVIVLFDDDEQAKTQADKLVADLKFRNVDAFRIDIEGDPGSMKQEDADYLIKQII